MGNPNFSGAYARRICTLMKVIRKGGWMTSPEIARALRISRGADQRKLLMVLEDEGLLESRARQKPPGVGGPAPVEFSVSEAWRDA